MPSNSYQVIKNPDGSPRWIVPEEDREALFLKFYPAFNKRNRRLRKILRLAFKYGLQNVCSKRLSDKDLSKLLGYSPSELSHEKQFALFTGTPGPNRKILLYERTKNDKAYFSKIAYGENAPKLIENEFRVLEMLNQKCPKHFWFPKLFSFTHKILKTHELKITESSHQWSPAHSRFLQEIYSWGIEEVESQSLIPEKILNVDCEDPEAQKPLEQLHNTLAVSHELIEKQAFMLKTAFGHGDFCPWNTAVKGAKLQVLDWELAGDYPMLYDLFHFVVQHEILNTGSSARAIFQKVRELVRSEDVRVLLSAYKLDWKHQFMAYLIKLSSYYSQIYARQSQLHSQAFKLMEIWTQLLELGNAYLKKDSFRKQFIRLIFEEIKETDYALMKFFEGDIELLKEESDLDIFIQKADYSKINKLISSSPLVSHSRIRRYSYMQSLELFFLDGSFLSIDLISQLKRRSLEYFRIEKVLEDAEINDCGIKLPRAEDNFAYIAYFYTLNGADIPEHYKVNYWHYANAFSSEKVSKKLWQANFSEGLSAKKQEELLENVQKRPENQGFSSLKNQLSYLADSIRKVIRRDSLTLTLSGVDGAGKSTLIARLKQRLEKKYRKEVVILRHRPSLLPILSSFILGKAKAEQKASETLPRQGKNRSYLFSYLRFFYYLLDYFLGEIFIWYRHKSRGKVILYDRYYFDFISDPRRSNLSLHKGFTKRMYRWINKAEVNIFLYAPVEEILSRKQELPAKEIESLCHSYKELFEEFERKYAQSYVNLNNLDLEESLDFIETLFAKAA
ncbi:MAG: phosphotransferase [Bacteroidia bacterium]|nr:phosphotransferase [Bacteroidia bacterium]